MINPSTNVEQKERILWLFGSQSALNHPWVQWEWPGIRKWRYVSTICLAILWAYHPLNQSPYLHRRKQMLATSNQSVPESWPLMSGWNRTCGGVDFRPGVLESNSVMALYAPNCSNCSSTLHGLPVVSLLVFSLVNPLVINLHGNTFTTIFCGAALDKPSTI